MQKITGKIIGLVVALTLVFQTYGVETLVAAEMNSDSEMITCVKSDVPNLRENYDEDSILCEKLNMIRKMIERNYQKK